MEILFEAIEAELPGAKWQALFKADGPPIGRGVWRLDPRSTVHLQLLGRLASHIRARRARISPLRPALAAPLPSAGHRRGHSRQAAAGSG